MLIMSMDGLLLPMDGHSMLVMSATLDSRVSLVLFYLQAAQSISVFSRTICPTRSSYAKYPVQWMEQIPTSCILRADYADLLQLHCGLCDRMGCFNITHFISAAIRRVGKAISRVEDDWSPGSIWLLSRVWLTELRLKKCRMMMNRVVEMHPVDTEYY